MVEILNSQTKHRINKRALGRLVEALVRRYRLKSPEIGLALVGDQAIRRLNRQYRQEDKVTDVLSFPIGRRASDGKYYLGDIIIAPGRAGRQARAKGHSLDREIRVLVIHGFLHLLGFGHFKGIEEEEARLQGILRAR